MKLAENDRARYYDVKEKVKQLICGLSEDDDEAYVKDDDPIDSEYDPSDLAYLAEFDIGADDHLIHNALFFNLFGDCAVDLTVNNDDDDAQVCVDE